MTTKSQDPSMMEKVALLLIALFCTASVQAADVRSLYDTFGNNDIAKNPDSVLDSENGWEYSENDVPGLGTLTELNGWAILSASEVPNHATIMRSIDTLEVLVTDTLKVTWDIASLDSWGTQGTGGRVGGLEWRIRSAGSNTSEFLFKNGREWANFLYDTDQDDSGTGQIDTDSVFDGFRVTLTANKNEWKIVTHSLIDTNSNSITDTNTVISGGFDPDNDDNHFIKAIMDHWDEGKNANRITARIQGNDSGSTVKLNEITAIVPEPSSFALLAGLIALSAIAIRRPVYKEKSMPATGDCHLPTKQGRPPTPHRFV